MNINFFNAAKKLIMPFLKHSAADFLSICAEPDAANLMPFGHDETRRKWALGQGG